MIRDAGAQKPILAAAMRNILPECILNRSGKGHFKRGFLLASVQDVCFERMTRADPFALPLRWCILSAAAPRECAGFRARERAA